MNQRTSTKRTRSDTLSTRTSLIVAAERLFGEKGIDGVSLREIASAAGQRNTNAVNYHFNGKEGLVDAIFARRISQMEEMRGRLLAEAESAGRLSDARLLMEILCLPYLSLTDATGSYPYAGFMLHFHQHYSSYDTLRDWVRQWPNLKRVSDLLIERVSYIPAEIARSRIMACNLMFHGFLIRADKADELRASPGLFRRLLDDTLESMTAALCVPHRQGRGTSGYPSANASLSWSAE